MKPLHTLLKEYISKSNYTIYQLAIESNINRTTLQKALSGERPISHENLSKLLPFLGLSVTEKRELDQAFLISQIGEITYQKHMYLKDLLEGVNLPASDLPTPDRSTAVLPGLQLQQTCPVTGIYSIITTICNLLAAETAENSGAYLYTVSDFHNQFFSNLYMQLQAANLSGLQIRHIIIFSKVSGNHDEASLLNLKTLSTLFPFAMSAPRDCELYYCYEEIAAQKLAGIPYPYYLILPQNVVLLSGDCQNALFLPKESITYYQQHFDGMLQASMPLLDDIDTASFLSTCISLSSHARYTYTLEAQPCIGSFVDEEMVQRCINKDLDPMQIRILSETLLQQCKNLQRTPDFLSIFSKKGYDDFVENGIIYQIPSDLYHPLSIKDRILLLQRLILANQSGQKRFILAKAEAFRPQMEFFIYDSAILFSHTTPENTLAQVCIMKEPHIIQAFKDFLLHTSYYKLIYTVEETTELFQKSISQLTDQLAD